MGQCASMCSKGHHYPSEINVEKITKTIKSKEQIISKYLKSPLYPKVIFLQKQVKKHLNKTKCLKKSPNFERYLTQNKTCEESTGTMLKNENVSVNNDKPAPNSKISLPDVIHTNNHLNTNMNNQNNNNYTSNISVNVFNDSGNQLNTGNNNNYNNTSSNNNVIQISTNIVNTNTNTINNIISVSSFTSQNIPTTDNNFIPSPCVIFIPSVLAFFKESPLLISNPFDLPSTARTSETDPRNGPFDGVIRLYPVIIEGEYTYRGQWKNGKITGKGIMTYKEANKIYGNFQENKIDGFTKIINEEGDIYQGFFTKGEANGYGIITTLKEASFQGIWLNNNQHGFGYEKWPKGGGYEGEYIEGKKDGIGILYFVQGGSYEGDFENNEMNGIGIISLANGKKYIGYCKNNKMDGYGVISWPDGKLFEGEFQDDRREGFGVYYAMKKIYVGLWKNSVLEGNVIIIEGNKIKKQYWENGRPLRTLPENFNIFFEKYVDNIISYKNEFKDLKRGIF